MRATSILVIVTLSPLAAAQKPEPKYEGKPLAYWVERLQKAENEKDRLDAVNAISAFGVDGAPAVPALLAMLDDRSSTYRALVTNMLCEIGPGAKEAVPVLTRRLNEKSAQKPREGKESDKNWEIWELVRILGAIGPDAKEAIPVLGPLLDDPDYQAVVIKALCEIGPAAKDWIPAIRRAVFDSFAPDSTSYASNSTDSLHKLGPDAAPLLIELLGVSNEFVRERAFEGLCKLEPNAIKGSRRLADLLSSESPISRYYAAVLSWKVEKNKAAIHAFAALLKEETGLFTDRTQMCLPDRTQMCLPENLLAVRAAHQLAEIGPDAKDALPALKETEALGFIMWYWDVSRVEKPEESANASFPVVKRLSSTEWKSFNIAQKRIAIAKAASEAIRKINPHPESKK